MRVANIKSTKSTKSVCHTNIPRDAWASIIVFVLLSTKRGTLALSVLFMALNLGCETHRQDVRPVERYRRKIQSGLEAVCALEPKLDVSD